MGNYPLIEISFILSGAEDISKTITDAMQITPSKVRTPSSFKNKAMSHMEWEISTGKQHGYRIDTLFDTLGTVIGEKTDLINEVKVKYGLDSAFIVVLHYENGDAPEITLSPNNISLANKLNSEISFDIYCY